MAALISGPRVLFAFFLAVIMVHPSLHFGDLMSRRMTRANSCVPAPLSKGRVKLLQGGLIVKYQCRRGTILWGAKYATCMSGEWDQRPPICVQRGCRPLAPLPLGSIMVTFEGAVALLKCRQGHYLATKSYSRLGRVIMNLRNETSGADYIYCDGRVWNATEYHCIPIPTTTTSPTPAATSRRATTAGPNLMTALPDLTIVNLTTITTTAYPETSTPVQSLETGTMAWATEGGVEAGKGTTADSDLRTPPPPTTTFSPRVRTTPTATTARFFVSRHSHFLRFLA
ncbi:uncharacterized protein [Hetaerina americana]|uniref:uncharacterized protein n=1 Tax=Hetaerina americana TaxID=62018 RepID=UPI003A7F1AF1